MQKRLRSTSLVLLASLTAIPALENRARAEELPTKALFTQMDVNQDGKLTANEIPQGQFRFFERVVRLGDENKDGAISLEEFTAALKGTPEENPSSSSENRGAPSPADTPQEKGDATTGSELFRRLDKNGDGKVSKDELPEKGQAMFAPLFEQAGSDSFTLQQLHDFRRDGERKAGEMLQPLREGDSMTAGEGSSFSGVIPLRRLRQPIFIQLLDTDGNGTLSAAEFANASKHFQDLDRNKDGELGPFELFGQFPRDPEDGTSQGRRMGLRMGAESENAFEVLFTRMDKNGDRQISKEEAPNRIQERFEKFDANSDGFMSKEELRDGLEHLKRIRNENE